MGERREVISSGILNYLTQIFQNVDSNRTSFMASKIDRRLSNVEGRSYQLNLNTQALSCQIHLCSLGNVEPNLRYRSLNLIEID